MTAGIRQYAWTVDPDSRRTVYELVLEGARGAPEGIALTAPGRPDATFDDVARQVERVVEALVERAIEPSARVALIVENGPEAACAFLGLAAGAVCAPLNPSYTEAELAFYLRDLRVELLVVSDSLDTVARNVARELGVSVVELVRDLDRPAGVFDLRGDDARGGGSEPRLPPGASDDALVLHTSGTTARPKIVPLTHGQLSASARNVADVLELRPTDRCLNVMPLFHIHGLVAALLASLHAGGSVACTPGFQQVHLFEWLRELEPTWLTAVPTMHHAILQRARREPQLVEAHGLRFLRSSSAALPLPVLEGLEAVFHVPVVEAYGMTEAAHQMASNPVSGVRKPRSVGTAAGPELTILDEAGLAVAVGEVGEVAIRGETVFRGYESNPDANLASFAGDWFRTGDLGRLDEDGYLWLSGRSKEIINRGGEKISPLEVDDVLLRHPAVEQVATFGVPDAVLGEEVAAAVVLGEGHEVDRRALQDFAAQTIAPFKVPRHIVVVSEIPKGATGKLQRSALASQLDLTEPQDASVAGSIYLEDRISAIWSDVLSVPAVDWNDDFFVLGGDSILGAEAIARVRDLMGEPNIPLVAIVRAPTPRRLAAEIEDQFGWDHSGLVEIQRGQSASRPLFCIHGVDADMTRFAPLARRLGPETTVYGFRPGTELAQDATVERIADSYLADMRNAEPEGPYVIVAVCMGATVGLELADRLAQEGEAARLVMIDPRFRRVPGMRSLLRRIDARRRQGRLGHMVRGRLARARGVRGATDQQRLADAFAHAREAYVPKPTTAPLALIRSSTYEFYEMPDSYLRGLFGDVVFEERLVEVHNGLFLTPGIDEVAGSVERALAALATR
jgi:acyl-CoA synthetase (AMP-forming)/AMP-acid ligase II/thioesterase domain-containing protein